jgi:hypothetical protein
VKQRSDESFENFDPLINNHIDNGDKSISCGNIFFGPDFHIGDHVFASRTENLMKTYRVLAHEFTRFPHSKKSWMYTGLADSIRQARNIDHEEIAFGGGEPYNSTAETVLCRAYLHANEIQVKDWLKTWICTDVNLMGNITVQWKALSKKWNVFEWDVKTNEDVSSDRTHQVGTR